MHGASHVGWQHALLWMGLIVTILLVVLSQTRGLITREAMAPMILLLIAFGYYTAGIFLIPRFLWVGLIVAVCYVVQVGLGQFSWSITGGVVALSLLVAAFAGRRGKRPDSSRR